MNPPDADLRKQWFQMKLTAECQMIDAFRRIQDPAKYPFVLLDTRARADYDKGRIPGAQSCPLDQLPVLATTLDPSREYVTYCYHET